VIYLVGVHWGGNVHVSEGKVLSITSEKSAPIHDKVSKGPHVLRGLQGGPTNQMLCCGLYTHVIVFAVLFMCNGCQLKLEAS